MIQRDYPYMYARVSAKRAKLYKPSDYENMLKMGPNGISRKMEEGAYKEDINQLGSNYDGVKLVELALAKNLAREMSELTEMADGNLQKVLKTYLRRYDILTLKRILRAKQSGKERIEDYLTPVGAISEEKLEELKEMKYEEVKESIAFDESTVNYQEYIEEAKSLAEVEKGLDQAYYDELNNLADKFNSQNLSDFILEEIEYENLKIVLRMKKYDLSEEEIRDRLLTAKNGRKVENLIQMEFDEALNFVISELNLDVDPQLESVEHAIEVHRLENALRMLHSQPLGLSSILGYVEAKITEVKNLRMLLRAKETGIQNQETIRRQLVLSN